MTRGYLTFVQNNNQVDYLKLAYAQALSIKATQSISSYAVAVDQSTMKLINDQHKKVFDYIIPIPGVDEAAHDHWKLKNEWKAFQCTPFDETVKLESDMLFTTSVDHWWDIMRKLDLCFTTQVVDYRGEVSMSRAYRKVFDVNRLPNVYNGFYYFKKTKNSEQFFNYAKDIFSNWNFVKNNILTGAADQEANTDLVFSLAAKLLDFEYCLPTQPIPRFAHMKGAINGWSANEDWRRKVYYQFDKTTLTVGATRQTVPFHYYHKNFINDEIIKHYETILS